ELAAHLGPGLSRTALPTLARPGPPARFRLRRRGFSRTDAPPGLARPGHRHVRADRRNHPAAAAPAGPRGYLAPPGIAGRRVRRDHDVALARTRPRPAGRAPRGAPAARTGRQAPGRGAEHRQPAFPLVRLGLVRARPAPAPNTLHARNAPA